MKDEELKQALINNDIKRISKILSDSVIETKEDMEKHLLEVSKKWWKNLDGVKFSDWGKDLFKYSILIKELDIPSNLFIDCLEKKDKSRHRLINYIQRFIKNRKNWFFSDGQHIRELFVKLESRSPKDYLQEYPRTTIKHVISAEDIVDALLGSIRTFEDLCLLVKLKDTVKLYIRPFTNLFQPFEWRAFVKDDKLIGVSQQFYNSFHDYENRYLDETKESIKCFMEKICIPNIKVKDFVADLYVNPHSKYWVGNKQILRTTVIETNPYYLSDPCLFESYEELENTKETFRFVK